MSFKSEFVANTKPLKGSTGKNFAKAASMPLVMRHMENVARAHLGYSKSEKVDWAAVDWTELLNFFKQIMPVILQLIALFGGL